MALKKLLSVCFDTKKLKITIMVLKKINQYTIRVEYEDEVEKIKESNHEVSYDFVYYLSDLIEKAKLDKINSQDMAVGYLEVYFGEYEYLPCYFSSEDVQNNKGLHYLIHSLLPFVDEGEDDIDKMIS